MELRRPPWPASSGMNRSSPCSFEGSHLPVYTEACGPAPGSIPDLVTGVPHSRSKTPLEAKARSRKEKTIATLPRPAGPISIARTLGIASISRQTQAFARRQ